MIAHPLATAYQRLVTEFGLAFEQRRGFVLLPFSLIAGMIAYTLLLGEPHWLVLATGAVVCALGLVWASWRAPIEGIRLMVQLSALWAGFCLLPLHGALFGTEMLRTPFYGTYEARVDEVLGSDGGRARVIISGITPDAEARAVPIRRARLILPVDVQVGPGDIIRAAMRFAPIPGPVLPGAFDGQFHSYFNGVGAYGNVTSQFQLVRSGDGLALDRRVLALRTAIADRIDMHLDDATAAIGKAMVVGDQSDIDDETREVMAASGLAHIYSISGLHLSIVAGGIYFLVRLFLASIPLAVGLPVKKIAAVVGLLSAFAYLALAGGIENVPAFRSTLMLALVFGAVLAGRQALTMRNVAIAALAILVIDPASIFRPSFQLSFAAVVALIGVYEMPLGKIPKSRGRFSRVVSLVSATAWTSFIAGGATMLFSAYHFQQTAPLGVVGNVLALPFVSLIIMPFGVVSAFAIPFGLDAAPFQIMGWGIDRMVDVAELVAGWSEGFTGNPLLAEWTLVASVIALAWFAFLQTRWRFLGPIFLVPLVLFYGLVPRPDILIADTTQAVAIRDGDGYGLVTGRAGSFAVEVWEQHFQTEISAQHSTTRCDDLACVSDQNGYSVATIKNAAAFAEDCGRHDLVITRLRAPVFCTSVGQIIDADQLARGGVHSLVWNDEAGRFDLRPALTNLNRPWRALQR
ncbi:ComEC/Rec2 family competence protein [Devosia sp. WQ 349]|nr:ComEC/Rec2 family competence protein [Devosia sp. WQ 349K1]